MSIMFSDRRSRIRLALLDNLYARLAIHVNTVGVRFFVIWS